MTTLITNPITKTKKIKKNNKYNYNNKSFNISNENSHYLEKKVINFSKFVNDALNFYRLFLNNPKKLMIELKMRNPELWKYVNRRKF